MVQRDLHYAIVDEVDSILIDEARTPLIISGPAEESTSFYVRVNSVIRSSRRTPTTRSTRKPPGAPHRGGGDSQARASLSVDNLYDPGNIEFSTT